MESQCIVMLSRMKCNKVINSTDRVTEVTLIPGDYLGVYFSFDMTRKFTSIYCLIILLIHANVYLPCDIVVTKELFSGVTKEIFQQTYIVQTTRWLYLTFTPVRQQPDVGQTTVKILQVEIRRKSAELDRSEIYLKVDYIYIFFLNYCLYMQYWIIILDEL